MPRVTYMTGVAPATFARDVPAPRVAGDEAWADALARLARSHRARLAQPDPSRPWLSTVTIGPDTKDGRRP